MRLGCSRDLPATRALTITASAALSVVPLSRTNCSSLPTLSATPLATFPSVAVRLRHPRPLAWQLSLPIQASAKPTFRSLSSTYPCHRPRTVASDTTEPQMVRHCRQLHL